MPMVGRGDDHRVDRLVVERLAEVLDALGLLALLGRGDRFAHRTEQPAIDIANVGDFAILAHGERPGPATLPRPRTPTIAITILSLAGVEPRGGGVAENRQPGSQAQAGFLGTIEKLAASERGHREISSRQGGQPVGVPRGSIRRLRNPAENDRLRQSRFSQVPIPRANFRRAIHRRGAAPCQCAR